MDNSRMGTRAVCAVGAAGGSGERPVAESTPRELSACQGSNHHLTTVDFAARSPHARWTRTRSEQAKVRTMGTADGGRDRSRNPYIVAVSMTNRYRTSLATTRSYALSISSAEINSISAPMPCWAQKSSISWVCAMPPIIEPASDLR